MSENNSFDPSKAMDQIKGDRNLTITAAGAVAVIIGIFLPWYSIEIFGISTSASPGLSDSTGILLLVFSVVAVAAGLNVMNQNKKNMAILSVVMGVLCLLIMLNNWPDSELGEFVSTGIGYWLSLAGSIAIIAGSAMGMQAGKSPAAAPKGMPEKTEDKE